MRLAYVVYLPAREGRFPVLVQYSPYLGGGLDPIKHQSNAAGAEMFLREGYAILSVSGRGTGCSEGVHELLSEWEARDGAALIEWAGAQPWSDGNVGMVGNSYSGTSLYLTAGRRPKYLKALAVGGSPVDAYRDAAYPGGIFNPGLIARWTLQVQPMAESMGVQTRLGWGDEPCRETLRKQLPNRTVQEVEAHPLYDEWWRRKSIEEVARRIEAPSLVVHGWQDERVAASGAVALYTHLAGPKKRILSNGAHGVFRIPAVESEILAGSIAG